MDELIINFHEMSVKSLSMFKFGQLPKEKKNAVICYIREKEKNHILFDIEMRSKHVASTMERIKIDQSYNNYIFTANENVTRQKK